MRPNRMTYTPLASPHSLFDFREEETGSHISCTNLKVLLSAVALNSDGERLGVPLIVTRPDEAGFQHLDRSPASLFFRLASQRYQRGSILPSSNKVVKDWPEVLAGDEVMTTAFLDRLLHPCHPLTIKGRSNGLRDIERLMR